MKKYYIFISTILIFLCIYSGKAQISPTSSPYSQDGPFAITADSSTVNSKKLVMYHPVSAPTTNKYPVFIFQPGANSLFSSAINVHSYDLYMKHLASYGYVVLVIDETSAGMPNGTTFKAVHDWFKTNVSNTSHWLYNFADPTKVAIGGHSNGGVNATACLIDRPTEIDAIVYFASYPSNNFLLPQDVSGYSGSVLDLAGNADQTSAESDCRTGFESYTSANCGYWVLINGMDHGGFGDYVNSSQPVGSIGRANATATVRHYLVSYLDFLFKSDVVAQASFQTTVLQPNTTSEFENSCVTTGLESSEYATEMSFYPNPVKDLAILSSNVNIDAANICLVDMTGKNITANVTLSQIDKTKFSFSFSGLNKGLYFLFTKGGETKPILINVCH